MKKQLLTTLLFLYSFISFAQTPRETLQLLRDSFPQEKIYIHFDKEVYIPGETIWFKAYLFSGFLPSDLSANLFVELVNDKNGVITYKKLPIVGGTVAGNFDLSDTLSHGTYHIRAYTPWMLNFDESFIYRKPLLIYKPTLVQPTDVKQPSYLLNFFPEGGDLIAGVVNVVAFKAIDPQGWPATVSGRLLDESGSEVSSFNSIHDGMGSFGFLPVAGQRYHAEIKFPDNSVKKFDLPDIKKEGWALQVREDGEKRRIILTRPNNIVPVKLLVIGQMQQDLVLETNIEVAGRDAMLLIDTKNFPSGILQLTVMTENAVPIVERLLFINNNDYRLSAPLVIDQFSTTRRSKNQLSFDLPDSLTGSYSVSVTDEDRVLRNHSGDDIVSKLLLTSDLKGYVHNPSYYFLQNDKTTRTAVDLLMMTNGWRRFSWQAVLQNKFPELRFRDQNYIQISGTVFSSATKKPIKEGEVNFIMRTKDSLTDFFQEPVGANGKFYLYDMIFPDTANFSFQLNAKKNKDKELYMELDKDPVDFQKSGAALLEGFTTRYPLRMPASDSLKRLYGLATDTTGTIRMLETVIVQAKKKRPIEELNSKYTRGLFSSLNMVRILDLVNNEPGAGALNVFQYIQGRIGGLRVISSGMPPTYTIYTGRAMSLTGGPIPVALFLDEAPATSTQLATIPMSDIAMIKYFQTGFMGNPGSGSTQALAVYSKKPSDIKRDTRGFLNSFSYPGYSVVREFYTPDYDESAANAMPDRRSTLLWQPDLKPDPETGKFIVRFFNNDTVKRVRVVVEGFTADGKIVREEKILQ